MTAQKVAKGFSIVSRDPTSGCATINIPMNAKRIQGIDSRGIVSPRSNQAPKRFQTGKA